jgi:predicted Zn-dependent protease
MKLMKVMQEKGKLLRSFLLMILAFLTGCAVDPVTGRTGLMLMSEEQEIQLGTKTDREIVKEYGIYDNREMTQYLAEIGKRLGALSHRPHLAYDFKILDTPAVNAFAVPGGYVYMTRGILAYLNSEAELACVLGHELGHITARHSAEQYSRAQLAQIGLTAGMILSPTLARLGDVAQIGVQMLFLSFSRENEREADDLAVEYASRAGYEASRMASFFETLERMNPRTDKNGLPDWFSTHPNPEDRLGAVRRRAAEWRRNLGGRDYKVGAENYLNKVNGLIYGEDPREGYVEKGVFYHPDLRFQFQIPDGWQLLNTREAIRLTSRKKDAAILIGLSSSRNPGDAAAAFVRQTNARVIAVDEDRIDGLPALAVTSRINTEKGTLGVLSYYIQKDGNIFEFIGFCAAGNFRNYGYVFEDTMRGFRRLTDPARLDSRPARIKVVSAPSSGALRQALASLGVSKEQIEATALLNGMFPEDPVRAGALIKIVAR